MVKALSELASLPVPDRSKLKEYPSLSLKERDRRFSLVRKAMKENNIDALILTPDGTNPLSYLGEQGVQVLFFPVEGDPVGFQDGGGIAVDRLMKTEAYGIQTWIKDRRFGRRGGKTLAGKLADMLTERGMSTSRISILPYNSDEAGHIISTIKEILPKVSCVDFWKPYVNIWLVKGPEEIAMFRKVALSMEVASWEFANACKPGNNLADIQTAVMGALLPHGVDVRVPTIGSGPDGGRGVEWRERGLKPPVMAKGDLVSSEMFCAVGSVSGQCQVTISIGKPNAQNEKLAGLARESYEIGVKTCRPGIPFIELEKAMAVPNDREGAWRMSPLAHSMDPQEMVTIPAIGVYENYPGVKERFKEKVPPGRRTFGGDVIIKEGMIFQFETDSCYGRTYVNIGGNIVVTKNGCEELNDIPCRMVVVPG